MPLQLRVLKVLSKRESELELELQWEWIFLKRERGEILATPFPFHLPEPSTALVARSSGKKWSSFEVASRSE
jgi:hypothetical protein